MRSSSVWLSMKDLPACNRDFMSMQNIESEGFGDCLCLWVWCFRGGQEVWALESYCFGLVLISEFFQFRILL